MSAEEEREFFVYEDDDEDELECDEYEVEWCYPFCPWDDDEDEINWDDEDEFECDEDCLEP